MVSAFGVDHAITIQKMVIRATVRPKGAKGKLRRLSSNTKLAAIKTGQKMASPENQLRVAALVPRMHA